MLIGRKKEASLCLYLSMKGEKSLWFITWCTGFRFRQLSGFFIRKNKRLCHLSGDWWWGVRLDHFQVWIEGKGLTWFLFCWKNKSTKMNGKQGERVQNTK